MGRRREVEELHELVEAQKSSFTPILKPEIPQDSPT
jgi:hypothetical protein